MPGSSFLLLVAGPWLPFPRWPSATEYLGSDSNYALSAVFSLRLPSLRAGRPRGKGAVRRGLLEPVEICPVVGLGGEDRLAVVAALDDVLRHTGKAIAGQPRHGARRFDGSNASRQLSPWP